jgi:hypothetical protein
MKICVLVSDSKLYLRNVNRNIKNIVNFLRELPARSINIFFFMQNVVNIQTCWHLSVLDAANKDYKMMF